jgi:hypothetical protein
MIQRESLIQTRVRVRTATVNVFDPATDLIRRLKNNSDSKESKSNSKIESVL